MTEKKKAEKEGKRHRFRFWLNKAEDTAPKHSFASSFLQKFGLKGKPKAIEAPAALAPPPCPVPVVVPISHAPTREATGDDGRSRRRRHRENKEEPQKTAAPEQKPKKTKAEKSTTKTTDTQKTATTSTQPDKTVEKEPSFKEGVAKSVQKFDESQRRRKRLSKEDRSAEISVDTVEVSVSKGGNRKISKKLKRRRRRSMSQEDIDEKKPKSSELRKHTPHVA
uniref:SRF-dependent transcription regulation-associated protein n=1 Tax=Steinernema glaseri TaxID=37863 RepID=A0A1I8APG8_9BILA